MNTKPLARSLGRLAAAAALTLSLPAIAFLTFYEQEGYGGRSFNTRQAIGNLGRYGFNDAASSVVVSGDRWEACEHANYQGQCVVLRQGRYPNLASMGLNDRISSVRSLRANSNVDESRYAPDPLVVNDYRRRGNERLYEAEVVSVRAVLGASNRRCWVEQEQVPEDRREANVPAALAGALIGGILGHQIGGDTGRDIATAGGVIAGAAYGSNVGRDNRGRQVTTQNVQRCSGEVGSTQPDYWDVVYRFRGQEHRVQMTHPPGDTLSVNRRGEPRA
jgi:uncharacterized protein YcfJ